MKILFVAHEGRDGIGMHSAGLRWSIPAALGPDDEFVVRSLTGIKGRRATRIVEQQLLLPFAERDAELVHLPDFRSSPLDRHRVLLTVHDVGFLDRPEWFPRSVRIYKSALLRLAAATRPAAIVCVSEYTRQRLVHHLPRVAGRLHVIPPGIDEPSGLAPEPSGDESYFLTISTIEPRKNHLGLLAAFRQARANGLRLRWHVAGTVGYNGGPIAAEPPPTASTWSGSCRTMSASACSGRLRSSQSRRSSKASGFRRGRRWSAASRWSSRPAAGSTRSGEAQRSGSTRPTPMPGPAPCCGCRTISTCVGSSGARGSKPRATCNGAPPPARTSSCTGHCSPDGASPEPNL